MSQSQICKTCNEEMDIHNFVSSKNYKANGTTRQYYRKICKECYNKAHLRKSAEYYAKNKEKIKERLKMNYAINKDKNEKMINNLRAYLEKVAPLEILQQIAQNL